MTKDKERTPARLSDFRGQRALDRLWPLLRGGRDPHALLFAGPEGTGKAATALAVALHVNCRSQSRFSGPPSLDGGLLFYEGCACASCRKIREACHPDIHGISGSGSSGAIRIDRIREIIAVLGLKPLEARSRVVIIEDAHRMTTEAANAMLKVLEEPPDHTRFVLTTSRVGELPATILSRCQIVRFGPMDPEVIRTVLMERSGVPPAEAASLAAVAGDGMAFLASGEGVTALRKRRDLRDHVAAGLDLLTMDGPPGPECVALRLSERFSRDRNVADAALESLVTWLRDLAIAVAAPMAVINADRRDLLSANAAKLPPGAALTAASLADAAKRRLDGNANPRLVMEHLWLELGRLLRGDLPRADRRDTGLLENA